MTSGESDFPPLRPNSYRDTWCGEVLQDRVGSRARLAGWVHRRRDHGGLVFIDLRDRTGIVQLVFHPDDSGEAFELSHRLRAEDVLTVAGEVVRRSDETVNPDLPTGEFELRVADATREAHSQTPPFEIEGFSGEVGEEARLRHRYLDLRRERVARSIIRRHNVTAAIRDFLGGEGFLDIETPMLSRSTPEGARDFLVPSRREPGCFYALPQSPQLFKQLLMVSGFERYFQIVRCFRDEDQRADRQPDFTQLDIEMSFVEVEDVLDLNERLLAAVFARVDGPRLELPLRRVTYDGGDRPLRHRPPGPALRPRADRAHRPARRDGVQGLSGRDRGRRDRQGPERRRSRRAAIGSRRFHRPRSGARRQGARLGLPRRARAGARRPRSFSQPRSSPRSTSGSARRRATCCSWSLTGRPWRTRCSPSCVSTLRSASS